MKKGLCFICEEPGHRANEHKAGGSKFKSKAKDDAPKRKDIRKLHAYLSGLTGEEAKELRALETAANEKKEKDDDSDSDF